MSKPINIKAIIVKDSETCSNDFIMGVLRGLDIKDSEIKLGVGDIKSELKDKSFEEILNIYARLKKNFNCFCVKVFWNDGRVQLLNECFKERSEIKEVENLKLEVSKYKIINAEISRLNEKLNKRPICNRKQKDMAILKQEFELNKSIDDEIYRINKKSDKELYSKNWDYKKLILQEINEEMQLINTRIKLFQETIDKLN